MKVKTLTELTDRVCASCGSAEVHFAVVVEVSNGVATITDTVDDSFSCQKCGSMAWNFKEEK